MSHVKHIELNDAERQDDGQRASRRALLAGSLKAASAGAVALALTGYWGINRFAAAQDGVITLEGSVASVSARPGAASTTAAVSSAAGDSESGAAAISAVAAAVAPTSPDDDRGAEDGGMRRIRLTRVGASAAAPEVSVLPSSGAGAGLGQSGVAALFAAAAAASVAGALLTSAERVDEGLEA